MMQTPQLIVYVAWVLGLTAASPVPVKIGVVHDLVSVDGRSVGPQDVVRPINNMVNRVMTSETAGVIDDLGTRVSGLIAGLMNDLGEFVVSTVDQLPDTINQISRTVNDAMNQGGEQVVIMVKSIRNEEPQPSQQILTKVDKPFLNTEVQESLQKLQDQIALTFGRIVATAYKNADQIDNALATTLRRVTGLEEKPSGSTGALANDVEGRSAVKTISSTLTDEDIKKFFPDAV